MQVSPIVRQLAIVLFLTIIVLLCGFSFAGALGIDDSPNAEQQQAIPSRPVSTRDSADAEAFATIADAEVSQFHEGITLAKWLATRGKREGWKKNPQKELLPTDEPPRECASYSKIEILPSGGQVVLVFYFLPPSPPSPVVFPTGNGSDMMNTCVLGLILEEAPIPVSDFGPAQERTTRILEFGQTLDQAVRRKLVKRLGQSVGTKGRLGAWRRLSPVYYKDAARWIANAEIVSAYSDGGLGMLDVEGLVPGPLVFVYARLPLTLNSAADTANSSRSIEQPLFPRLIGMAGQNATASKQMEQLYDEVSRMRASPELALRPEDRTWHESIYPMLRDWLTSVKSANPPQQAAGLLVADILLGTASGVQGEPFGMPKKLHPRLDLQRFGASFELYDPAGVYVYSNSWLKGAMKMDPEGEVGRLALLISLARRSCDPRKIIADGENLLQKSITPSTAAQVHFIVGDAYSDIVTIAAGRSGPNGEYDPSEFQAEAASAHNKALEHYRAGLAADNSSENAKAAWRQAWRLSSGTLPDQRYVCFGD